MRVVHAQAERILAEYPDGVPGYESIEYKLEKTDQDGVSELQVGGHASAAAFARAAGVIEAPTVQIAPTCLQLPQILGLPNVGQYVTADAGVWDEPTPDQLGDPAVVERPSTWIAWLYDGNEQDPVVIPEGSPQGKRSLRVPALAIGRTIRLRVTRGQTTVYSQDFGPVEGGLTEFTSLGQPVRDRDVVSAEPASRRRSGASAPSGAAPSSRAQTPTSGTKSAEEKGGEAEKPKEPGKAVKASKAEALAKRAAEDFNPPPAQPRPDV